MKGIIFHFKDEDNEVEEAKRFIFSNGEVYWGVGINPKDTEEPMIGYIVEDKKVRHKVNIKRIRPHDNIDEINQKRPETWKKYHFKNYILISKWEEIHPIDINEFVKIRNNEKVGKGFSGFSYVYIK